MEIQLGLSLMLEDDFRLAVQPLFDQGLVQVVEWTFDMGWGQPVSEWLQSTLNEYSTAGNLLGHGVSYSPLDASETARQEVWLDHLDFELSIRKYRHLSEHFGFMGSGNFHTCAPLPVPLTPEALDIGRSRLRQLASTAGVQVGLENLAFAFGPTDVQDQGQFLEQLLVPTDGFLLLDLHNIYCQLCNFSVPDTQLLESYPLHLVREVHISGGSWSIGPESQIAIRRDTHDEAVPERVFQLLETTIPRCPNLEFVILERLGGTLGESEASQFQTDFLRLSEIVRSAR